MFGNNQNPQPQNNEPAFPSGTQNGFQSPAQPPSMGKTRMMNEIQEQIKINFDQELGKLRSEMNSRQKELRNHMEKLKSEAERALVERNEAHEELKRMKELLDKKRDQENHHKGLMSAINKYAPEGESEYGNKRAASRGGVDMNNYEKMFFNNGGKDMQVRGNKDMQLIGGKSLKADSALIPVDHNDTITNYFNKNSYNKQDDTMKSMKGDYPVFERSPGSLKKSHAFDMNDDHNAYNTNLEIPTINTNIKNQIKREKIDYNYGADFDDKSSIKADDTLDFISKINNVGHRKDSTDSTNKKFSRQQSLKNKANELKSNRLNESSYTEKSKNNGHKLDIDNFPSLPDYEGIQKDFMGRNKEDSNDKYRNNMAEPLNTSMLSDNTVQMKMTGMAKARDTSNSFANGTSNTLKTINSINLEKINNRNENRLNDIENKYNFNGGNPIT